MRTGFTSFAAGIALLGGAAWLGFQSGFADAQETKKSPTAKPPIARPGTLELRNCRIKLPKNVQLSVDRPGVLAIVEPKEGDPIQDGQVVARLIDDVAVANVEIAEKMAKIDIEVRYAEKLHDLDVVKYNRALDANKRAKDTVPEMEVRELKLAHQRSELQIEKAKTDLEVNALKLKQAEAEAKTYKVIAPFAGVVTRILKYTGEAVRQGDPILEIVNTEHVQVEGKIEAEHLVNVKPGCPVTVRLDVPTADLEMEKKEFSGRIGFVDVIANPGDRMTRVWADVANSENILRGGLNATMTILVEDPSTGTPQRDAIPRAVRDSAVIDRGSAKP